MTLSLPERVWTHARACKRPFCATVALLCSFCLVRAKKPACFACDPDCLACRKPGQMVQRRQWRGCGQGKRDLNNTDTQERIDALMARYVSGLLPEPARVLVDAHLELSPANRGIVTGLETLAGDALEHMQPVPLHAADACLEKIFSSPAPQIRLPSRPRPGSRCRCRAGRCFSSCLPRTPTSPSPSS